MPPSRSILVVLPVVLGVISTAGAADWPQFRGPGRDGTSAETGLMKQWPKGGPAELWSCAGLGMGYSSVAVVDGVVYTCGMIRGQGYLFAIDSQGKIKYKVDYGPEWNKAGNSPGTRTTPTLDGERLYLMSGQGRIACCNAADGKRIWSVDTFEKFGGKNIRWGIAESVLIDGEKAICTPGGKDATMVALNKMTGETLWTSRGLSQLSAYCSPMLVERGGKRLVVTLVEKSLAGIDAGTGQVYWTMPHQVSYDIQAVSPLYKDGMVFVSNGYHHGSVGYALSADGTSAEQKWTEKSLDIQHGGAVLVDGKVHGSSTRGRWICLDLATGKVAFSDKLVGKGSVIYVDGMLYGYGENGKVGLIRIKPDGYELVSSFQVKKGSDEHWAHPAISDGRLYIRHGDVLMCYDIKAR
jgi:outer membrane protein assembly factor BamB